MIIDNPHRPSRLRPESNLGMVILSFPSSLDFRRRLAANHSQTEGIWLRIDKKDSGVATVTYAEALDQALCFGWIDGQKKVHDRQAVLATEIHAQTSEKRMVEK